MWEIETCLNQEKGDLLSQLKKPRARHIIRLPEGLESDQKTRSFSLSLSPSLSLSHFTMPLPGCCLLQWRELQRSSFLPSTNYYKTIHMTPFYSRVLSEYCLFVQIIIYENNCWKKSKSRLSVLGKHILFNQV